MRESPREQARALASEARQEIAAAEEALAAGQAKWQRAKRDEARAIMQERARGARRIRFEQESYA